MNGIELNNVSYSYSGTKEALHKVSLKISAGESVGILGRNGAGKSTLLRLLNGLLQPTSGTIYIDGEKTTGLKSSVLTKKVGLMFQNPEHQLFCGTVDEEINFSLKSLKLSQEDYNSYKNRIIEDLELEKYLNKSPFALSGGERKKISIASILVRKPQYLLFDEPTVGQDRKQRIMLENIIKLAKESKNTVLIVSHDTDFIYNLADRVIIFEQGQIIADGKTKEILSDDNILKETSIIKPQALKLVDLIRHQFNNTPNHSFNTAILDNITTNKDLLELLRSKLYSGGY